MSGFEPHLPLFGDHTIEPQVSDPQAFVLPVTHTCVYTHTEGHSCPETQPAGSTKQAVLGILSHCRDDITLSFRNTSEDQSSLVTSSAN